MKMQLLIIDDDYGKLLEGKEDDDEFSCSDVRNIIKDTRDAIQNCLSKQAIQKVGVRNIIRANVRNIIKGISHSQGVR